MESDHCIARPVFCSGELKLEHTGHHILSVDINNGCQILEHWFSPLICWI